MKERLYAKEILKNIETDSLDLSILMNELKESRRNKEKEKILEEIAANQDLVGRYFKHRIKPLNFMFPECWKYYKVISAYSKNCYRVECLIFDEYPTYWFNSNWTRDFYNICGTYDFDSFYTDNIMAKNLREDYIEISSEEYWLAAKKYLNYLRTMDWPSKHYRGGGVWPHELKWKEK